MRSQTSAKGLRGYHTRNAEGKYGNPGQDYERADVLIEGPTTHTPAPEHCWEIRGGDERSQLVVPCIHLDIAICAESAE